MLAKSLLASAALLAGAVAQRFAPYKDGGRSLSVNMPDSANTGTNAMYMQITAPSGTQWLAFGMGSSMATANMFIIYSSGSTPVLSTRTATGEVMPRYDSSIQATILSGSGISSDGTMVVNLRCDNCLSGSYNPTSTASKWIMAYKSGSALGSSSKDATISQHDTHKSFNLDLTAGVGGSSTNPFVAASQSSGTASGTASATGSASATNGVSVPVASNTPDSGSTTTSSSDNTGTLRSAHGIIMSVLFLAMFPFFALTLYLPTANKVRFIHAPLQILSVILLIVAMALGIVLGMRINELDTYHQIIGFIVVAILVLVQPILGILQHMHFHKTGGRSVWGPIHQNVGRLVICLGIVNGGLGWQLAGSTGAYVPYAIVSVLVFVIYAAVVAWSMFRAKSPRNTPIDKENKIPNGYEMNNTHRRLTSDGAEQTTVQPKQEGQERV